MRILILFFALLGTVTASAHQADLSTTMLVERADGAWELHLIASLTAFQYEVQTHYGEDAYATPEAFEELVVEHLQRTIAVRFENREAVTLTPIRVALGHETRVAFSLTGVPETVAGVEVTNTAFADIHRNKSALVVIRPNAEQQHFELTAENGHTAAWGSTPSSPVVALSLSVLGLAALAFGYRRFS